MNIKKQLVSDSLRDKKSYGLGNKKKTVTIHDTGNRNKGADAQVHANLQSKGNVRSASWHWQVDDKEAIQSLPHEVKCWHAGDGRTGEGNNNSIAIEICINSDGDYVKSVKNGAKLAAKILKDEGLSVKDLRQHYDWSKKDCPKQIRAGRDGITWERFVSMVEEELAPKPPKKPSESRVLYRVQTGAYRNVSNAKTELYRLQKKGYDTYTVKSGNLYRVQVGAYSEKGNARQQAERLKADGFATYITTESGSPVDIGVEAPPKPSNKLSLPNGVLRKGSKGDDVKSLQEALNAVYFKVGAVDGVYGAKTFDAVKRFQSVYLPTQVDGIYGPNTKKALERQLRSLGK